jgi:hypothetical protein
MKKLSDLLYGDSKETGRDSEKPRLETERTLRETGEENEHKLMEALEKGELRVKKACNEIDQEISQQGDHIPDTLRRLAELMIAPAVVKFFNEKGIPITDYAMRMISETRGIDYGLVLTSEEYIIVVFLQMIIFLTDVREFLEVRLPTFKEAFPKFREMKVVGAVAGNFIIEGVEVYAAAHGLYVLAQSDRKIIMLNNDSFQPKIY